MWVLLLIVFLGLFVWSLNARFPMIGHDYFYFFPRLLAGKWHFVHQGIFPFRFTPHFCGGIPQYGNPQDMYYSLPQLFSFFFDLWHAVQLSFVVAIIIGYWGWFRFGKDIVRLPSPWAHTLALIILANGWYTLHMIVGHVVFHTLPLSGLLLWLLLERKSDTRKSLTAAAALFALVSAYILYSGGYFVLFLTGLGFLLFLPYELALSGENLRSRLRVLLPRILACGIGALLIYASKLVAVGSFMRFFPRHVPFKELPTDVSTLWFIFKAFFKIPQTEMVFDVQNVGVHDYSNFTSPVVLLGLFLGAILLWKSRASLQRAWKRPLFLFLYSIFLLFFFMQMTQGYGFIMTILKDLPIFASLQVVTRFLIIPATFLSIIGVYSINRFLSPLFAHTASIVTLLAFFVAYATLFSTNWIGGTMPFDQVKPFIAKNRDFVHRPVTEVTDWEAIVDFKHLFEGSTNIRCHEPLFGLHNEFQVENLHAGPIQEESEGFFNLSNPACFQYPEENQCVPGERIRIEDRENLFRFASGEEVTWKLSVLQHVSDYLSLAMLIGCILVLRAWRKN